MFKYFRALKRLSEHDEALLKLERQVRDLQIDMEDHYERVKRLYQRIAKRTQRMEGSADSDTEEAGGVAAAEAASDGLTPRQREVNQRIMARRNRGATQ